MKPNNKKVQLDEKHDKDARSQSDGSQYDADQDCADDYVDLSRYVEATASVTVAINPVVLHLRFGPELLPAVLSQVGVPGWNDLVRRIVDRRERDVDDPAEIPPIRVLLDFSGLVMRGRNLNGIDLRGCFLAGADLSRCSLAMAKFSKVPRTNFEGADLRAALFEVSDISGARFTGADVFGLQQKGGLHYRAEEPPIGIPVDLLGMCRAWGADFPFPRIEEREQPMEDTKGEILMKRSDVERFFDDFGTKGHPCEERRDVLYAPAKDEKICFADWGGEVGKPKQRIFYVRLITDTDRTAVIRATTVVLRADTLLCFDAWQNANPSPKLTENGRDMNIDVTEVLYSAVVALKLRCKALSLEEVKETCLF